MSFAKMAAIWGIAYPIRILCVREIQSSIKESFHAELKAAIESEPWLEAAYDVGRDYLRSKINTTEFLFKGLFANLTTVKSTAQVGLTIVEEAEDVSEDAWLALEATVLRAPGSEIWTIWNPKLQGSPVDLRFRGTAEKPPMFPDALIAEMNYSDNPWFPPGLELLRKAQQASLDPETYNWIWKGAYLKKSKASILGNHWEEGIRFPDDNWLGPYHGLDWGFATDPTAAVRCWISPDEKELYIDAEAGGVAIGLDDTAKHLKERIPGIEKHPVIADSAQPANIDHLKRSKGPNGLPKDDYLPHIEGAVKGQGSVEDGLDHLKTYRIIVHPACPETQNELQKYSYKIDRLTGEVLPVIVDKHNHWIDALRYALEKVMRAKGNQVGMLFKKRR